MQDLSRKRVCVVVLGDIGHSPRMQYHVRSLLQHGCDVDLIGYVDTPGNQKSSEIKQSGRTKAN